MATAPKVSAAKWSRKYDPVMFEDKEWTDICEFYGIEQQVDGVLARESGHYNRQPRSIRLLTPEVHFWVEGHHVLQPKVSQNSQP